MKEQRIITSGFRQIFEQSVIDAIAKGWRVIPGTLVIAVVVINGVVEGSYIVFMER